MHEHPSKHLDQHVASSNLIDANRYPIDDIDGAGAELIARCRADLATTGACQLDGFLRADAVKRLVSEALALTDVSFRNEAVHNVYFPEEVDPDLPEDDPRRMMERASQATVAYDLIP